jgi:hypothetical protein
VPEPVRGNPLGKAIVFVAANPGGGKTPLVSSEQRTCPWWDSERGVAGETDLPGFSGDWGSVLNDEASFARHHLRANELAAADEEFRRGYASDMPMRAATGIVAALTCEGEQEVPHVPDVNSRWFIDHVSSVALLNVAHCKSRQWPEDTGSEAVGCAAKTFELLELLRPRVAVFFGCTPWDLLACAVRARSPQNTWRAEDESRMHNDRSCYRPPHGTSVSLRWNDREVTSLVSTIQPTRQTVSARDYSPEHVRTVVATIRAVLNR